MTRFVFDSTNQPAPTTANGAHVFSMPAATDTLYLAQGAMLRASGASAYGIRSTFSDHTISIHGSVMSTGNNGRGLSLGDRNKVTVGTSGTVYGATYGMYFSGSEGGNEIINDGSIEGDVVAIQLDGGSNTIVNAGTIFGATLTVLVSGTGPTFIHNTGTIRSSTSNNFNVALSSADDVVVNKGYMLGVLHLGLGNDLYDGRGGYLNGILQCSQGNDTVYGGEGGERILMGSGNDVVDGGGGVDSIEVNNEDGLVGMNVDLRITAPQDTGFGVKTILNVENIIITTGQSKADVFTGTDGDNVLVSAGGNDLVSGLGGNDRLEGGDQYDTLEGGLGNDTLDGGVEGDTARYSGAASAIVDLSKTVAQNTGGYGTDTLLNIENLDGGGGDDTFIGSAIANILTGNGGADTLIGGKGDDTLDGGAGDDAAVFSGDKNDYAVAHHADGTVTIVDTVANRDGADLLKGVRFAIFNGLNAGPADDETVVLTNAAPGAPTLSAASVAENTLATSIVASLSAVDADGDALTYSLTGNAGGFFALDGNKLVLARALDYETQAQHTLTVRARDAWGGESVSAFTLSVSNVVETTLLMLTGTAGSDGLSGEAGNDVLYGLSGNDRLQGETGNDILAGGLGRDMLSGGAGRDIFVFDSRPARANSDTLADFSVRDDTIHLAKSAFAKIAKKGVLAASAFWTGERAHDASDRIVYNKKTGVLLYDADGSGKGAALEIAKLAKNLKLTASDFFVI